MLGKLVFIYGLGSFELLMSHTHTIVTLVSIATAAGIGTSFFKIAFTGVFCTSYRWAHICVTFGDLCV